MYFPAMKKLVSALVLFSFLCLCATAQELTAEQIVARHIEVTVNKGYSDTIRSNKLVARAILTPEQDTLTMTIIKVPGQSYYRQFTGTHNDIKLIYHQGSGAHVVGKEKEKISDKAELDDLKIATYLVPELKYKELGCKLKLEGEARRDGVEYYVVKLQTPNGNESTRYFDKQSGLLTIVYNKDGSVIHITGYIGFKGGLYPNKFTVLFPNGGALEMTVVEYDDNVKIDPSLFEF